MILVLDLLQSESVTCGYCTQWIYTEVSPGGVTGKEPARQCRRHKICETYRFTPGSEDPLEEDMATHSSYLFWRIPWREEPGRIQYIGCQRVRHDWRDWLCTYMYVYIYTYIYEYGYMYIYPLFFGLFSFIGYYRVLSSAPCTI